MGEVFLEPTITLKSMQNILDLVGLKPATSGDSSQYSTAELRGQIIEYLPNPLMTKTFSSIWKAMSLNESMKPQDRAKLAVWDYPVSDKFTNMWRYMQEVGLPETTADAVQRVLTSENGFAFIGRCCDLQSNTGSFKIF